MPIQLIALFRRRKFLAAVLLGFAVSRIGFEADAGTIPQMASGAFSIAYVNELPDERDVGRFSGSFASRVEGAGEEEWGPEGPIEQVLTWAREKADVVYVLVGDSEMPFSAGRQHPDPEARPWPEAGIVVRPRPRGTPADGSVQTRSWPLRATVLFPRRAASLEEVNAILASSRALKLKGVRELGGGEFQLNFTAIDRGASAAVLAADRLLSRELADLDPEVGVEVYFES